MLALLVHLIVNMGGGIKDGKEREKRKYSILFSQQINVTP